MTEQQSDWLAGIVLAVGLIWAVLFWTVFFPSGISDIRALFTDRPAACQYLTPDECTAYVQEQHQ